MKNFKDIVRYAVYGKNRKLYVSIYNLILYSPSIFCLVTGNFDMLALYISIAFIGDFLYIIALLSTASDDIVVEHKTNKKESLIILNFKKRFSFLMKKRIFNILYNSILYFPIIFFLATKNYTLLNVWFLVAFVGDAIYIIGTSD